MTAGAAPPEWTIEACISGFLARRDERFSVAAREAGARRLVVGPDLVAVSRLAAEQESISDLAGSPLVSRVVDLIAVLGTDYPAWRIQRVTPTVGSSYRWWATRYAQLTDAQRDAGLVPSIARPNVVSLVMELAVQAEIAHRVGYASPPSTAP